MTVYDEKGNVIGQHRLSFINGQLAVDGKPLADAKDFWRNYNCEYRMPDKPVVRTGIWSERQGRFFDSVAEALAAGSADTPAVVPAKEG